MPNYRVPPLKPVRIPPSLSDEDKNYLAAKRLNQNNCYELVALYVELLRKHQDKGERILKSSFTQAVKYVFPPTEEEERKSKTSLIEKQHLINNIGE